MHYRRPGLRSVLCHGLMHTCTYSRKASSEFPRETSDVWPAAREEPVEKLLGEMEQNRIDQAVLVQMAGTSLEQHRYLLQCLKDYPNRFRGIGLIPQGHPNPAEHIAELTR